MNITYNKHQKYVMIKPFVCGPLECWGKLPHTYIFLNFLTWQYKKSFRFIYIHYTCVWHRSKNFMFFSWGATTAVHWLWISFISQKTYKRGKWSRHKYEGKLWKKQYILSKWSFNGGIVRVKIIYSYNLSISYIIQLAISTKSISIWFYLSIFSYQRSNSNLYKSITKEMVIGS